MGSGFATVTEEDGVVARSASLNGFILAELQFPPRYVQAAFEPDLAYLAFVLDGRLQKSFRLQQTIDLEASCAVTMPAGATHGARFGPEGARIVIVKPPNGAAGCLDRLDELRGRGLSWLAWRLAAELRATDAAAPLAAEGLALELLAATSRETRPERPPRRPPAWLRAAEELLRARARDCVGLVELAEAVGVHPTHLARVFRAHYGVSVGEYGRRLKVTRAATEVARSDTPLNVIALRAGFSDQSHFTRLFKRYVGTTPARYRAEAHATLGTFQVP
jgi:AraC family transcriptional regulator